MSNLTYFFTRKDYLEQSIPNLEKELKEFPTENLVCYKNGNSAKYFSESITQDGKRKRTYIPKHKREYATKLARKAVLAAKVSEYKKELLAIKRYLNVMHTSKVNKILSQKSLYMALLNDQSVLPYDITSESTPLHPEGLNIRGPQGKMFRSKSEAIIAMSLFEHNISYKYEFPHIFDDIKVYSDFTISHPITGQEIIWEHFGLADNLNYQGPMLNKIRTYISNGYVPGSNLIITFETKTCPLDISYLENLISYHFLDH